MNLDSWIDRASRGLAPESRARVQAEIEEHFRCAMEEPFATEVAVVRALGDPRVANRAYKRVLVTAAEARLMHWNAFGDRQPKLSLAVFLAIAVMWGSMGTLASTWIAIVMVFEGFLVALPRRGRPYTGRKLVTYRCLRMVWGVAFFGAVGSTAAAPLVVATMVSPLAFYVWNEWMNARIRRKLPVDQWPKAIYLF